MAGRAAAQRTAPLVRCFSGKARERLILFDTTLRDGEQSPGATLNLKEKLDIARQLSRLGVDVCEAGFPIASQGDFEAVQAVAKSVGTITEGRASGRAMTIAGLARANKKDIDRCFEATSPAHHCRIHTFLASSDIHLEHKLGISRSECIEQASAAVKYAASMTPDVEFSPEDAGRSDPEFLVDLCAAVIEAGATTLNIPDTVGYTIPEEYGNLFLYLIANAKGGTGVIWSTHCHNDLGLATANTLAAVQHGARQVEVTLNGIGERAGNTSLEEVVMSLKTRPQFYPVHLNDVDTTQIMRTSRLVSAYTGINVQPNKAIVGANAFAHEAGIHQHGVLKHAATYEIMTPESVGLGKGHSNLVLGKHSGKAAYRQKLMDMGYDDLANDDYTMEGLVQKFKGVADQKKTINDADIEAVIANELNDTVTDKFKFHGLEVTSVTKGPEKVSATATVHLIDAEGETLSEAATGNGPVHATFKAISRIVRCPVTLAEYRVSAVTGGKDALGGVAVKVYPKDFRSDGKWEEDENAEHVIKNDATEHGVHLQPWEKAGIDRKQTFSGHGASTDIIVASARAYLNAINRVLGAKEKGDIQAKAANGYLQEAAHAV